MKNRMLPYIFILGVQDKFRGKNLIDEFTRDKISFEIHWANKIKPQDIVDKNISDSGFAKFAIGRQLKHEEISCANGHNAIYKKIYERRLPWSIILEDDVKLINDLSNIKSILWDSKVPTIIYLNALVEKVNHFNDIAKPKEKQSRGVIRQFLPKNIACSYAINLAAVEMIREVGNHNLISSPDWPYRWSSRVDFYQVLSPIFMHPAQEDNSLIGKRLNDREKMLNRIPNPIRLARAVIFRIPFGIAFKTEIVLKSKLIFRQLLYKIGEK